MPVYAMRVPSGDQSGVLPYGVSSRTPVPSAAMTKRPDDPPAHRRENAMLAPSGDHAGSWSAHFGGGSERRRIARRPTRTTAMLEYPLTASRTVMASRPPSGDHAGSSSRPSPKVAADTPLPSAAITKMCVLRPSEPRRSTVLTKAMRSRPGDHAGDLSSLVPDVSVTSPVPSARITWM